MGQFKWRASPFSRGDNYKNSEIEILESFSSEPLEQSVNYIYEYLKCYYIVKIKFQILFEPPFPQMVYLMIA